MGDALVDDWLAHLEVSLWYGGRLAGFQVLKRSKMEIQIEHEMDHQIGNHVSYSLNSVYPLNNH